jgi:hypothetical protein
MFCPNCGGEFESPVAGRCPLCGTRVAEPATPAPGGAPGAPPPPPAAGGGGCPFEDPSLGFFDGLWETIKQVIARPVPFFQNLPDTSDIGKPVLFAIILGTVGGVLYALWQLVMMPLQGGMGGMGGGDVPPELRQLEMLMGPAAVLMSIILAPVLTLIGLFVSAGIFHLFLLMFGGPNRGFAATLRVVAYTTTLQLFYGVPFCGGIVVGIWSIVLHIIGLTQAHRTDAWRAVLAVLLPGILCICACAFLFMTVMGAALSAAGAAQ